MNRTQFHSGIQKKNSESSIDIDISPKKKKIEKIKQQLRQTPSERANRRGNDESTMKLKKRVTIIRIQKSTSSSFACLHTAY